MSRSEHSVPVIAHDLILVDRIVQRGHSSHVSVKQLVVSRGYHVVVAPSCRPVASNLLLEGTELLSVVELGGGESLVIMILVPWSIASKRGGE